MLIRSCFLSVSFLSLTLCAQNAPPQDPAGEIDPGLDILTFKNGEKLAGRFVRSDGSYLIFKSESLGEVTVYWSQIQDLKSTQTFAVIEKQTNFRKGEDPSKFPQGTVSIDQDNLIVRGADGSEKIVPIRDTSHVLDQSTFERAVADDSRLLESPFHAWSGTATGGISVVEGTQTSQTYTGAINFIRAVPEETWLDRRQRTLLNLNASYGTFAQAGAETLRTEIYHGDLEHDVFFTTRFFSFAQTSFDHNFSLGLSLAQNYGGGIGWTVLKNETSEIDLRSSLTYLKQEFADPTQNQNLVGSIFSQNFIRRFRGNTVLTQRLTARPAWNNLNAYSATGNVTLTLPIYKRLLFTVGVYNTFINNPSPGFRKNAFQATTGFTYSLK